MPHHVAFISVGSNIGDKLRNCRKGIAALTAGGRSILKGQSHFYRTEPVDYSDQDWFVNAVVKIETRSEPAVLFRELKSIEKDVGRKEEAIRFGPRILDLDILLYDRLIMESVELTIPHPRMHQRRFVLQPMCDIDPLMLHPVLKKDMRSLQDALGENEQRIIQIK
ncbi:MAG: 2-amino-4-hydroxy-6-hydroxymethyldihydropteridine diphosphokinase [Desulfobacterales bacterium]|nr:2-amino-4-hydroxy-6-hydroxymethyldihydropteridine diphosphokinase [Desulfobacterales bacterium]